MAYDAQACDLDTETDEVIRDFGMALTQINLFSMAAEMERRRRQYPGGLVRADQVICELRRRALSAPAMPGTPAPRPRPGG